MCVCVYLCYLLHALTLETHITAHTQVTINSVMVNCATGIEIYTLCQEVPSDKARELTALNLKENLMARGLTVTFDERRRMKEEEAIDGQAQQELLLHDPASLAAALEESLMTEGNEGRAGVQDEDRTKQNERRFELRHKLASVFSSHSGSPAASGLAGGAECLEEAVDEASRRNLLGAIEMHSTKPVAAASSRTFIVVLPYTLDEFTSDLQTQFKHAVAKTAGVSTEKVFTLLPWPLLSPLALALCLCMFVVSSYVVHGL